MLGNIGMTELLLIFVVALIVLGPQKLPDIAKTLGKTIAEFRRATNDVRHNFTEQLEKEQEYAKSIASNLKSDGARNEEQNMPAESKSTEGVPLNKSINSTVELSDQKSNIQNATASSPTNEQIKETIPLIRPSAESLSRSESLSLNSSTDVT